MTDVPPDLAKLLRQPDSIEFEGKTFKLRELTFEQRAKFAQWLKDRALAAAERAGETCPEYVKADLRKTWVVECAAGTFDFGGDAFLAALRTHAGQVKSLHLCLSDDHPDLTEAYAERMWLAERAKLAELVREKIGDPKFLEAMAAFAGRTPSPPSATTPLASASKPSRSSRRHK